MIKNITSHNIVVTPFNAIKSWELSNVNNIDLILTEINPSGSLPIALEYPEYTVTGSVLNRDCNISLEQQSDDLMIYEEGIMGSGLFYPNIEPKNLNGSYKRLLYTQTLDAFYNTYRNPIEIFGMENIDFLLSKTNRFISDKFRMFTIPHEILGDKMVEGSIQLFDSTLDDNVTVVDDYNCNLIASENIFSKIQEIREFGSFQNFVFNETANYSCSLFV
jgi:hypothetical protein